MEKRSLSILLLGTQMATGGAQKVLLDQAKWFHQRGHKVVVAFFYDKEGFHSKWQAVSDFPIIDLKAVQIWKGNGILLITGLFALWRLIRREKIEVVETFTHDSNILGLPIAWIAGVPVRLGTHHGVIDGFPRWRQWIHTFIVNHMADAVIAVSAKMKDQAALEGIPSEHVIVIQNGIEPVSLEGVEGSEVRKEAGLDEKDIFLISVGRLVYQKAHQVLVSAMPLVLSEFPHVKVGICGDGILRSQLEIQINELGLAQNVKLLGKSEHIARFLSIADIFVLPSRWEGLPIALLEAMSAGLPVVATAVEGVDEAVVKGEHGLLVAVEDINGLAQAILQLLRDPELRKKMGAASRARVQNFYSIDHMAGRYLSLMFEKIESKIL
jgi:glycosyltransferase involved in cell wall biosynthesis